VDLMRDRPHSARIYDYLLGGKDNFQADRAAADEICKVMPHLPDSMMANRRFMVRMVSHLAALGLDQFLDGGTGLPTRIDGVPNLHQAVQAVIPQARIVYVDNDPIVHAHARALLTGTPEGKIAYVMADLHHPEAILNAERLQNTLDLSKPVALALIAVMHYFEDEDEAHHVIDQLLDPLASGSMLAISTTWHESNPTETHAGVRLYRDSGIPCKTRTRAEIEGLFRGLELMDPGVVPVHHWFPDEVARSTKDEHVMIAGGVAVKK
jgi:hypothetical protein